ncbi:MAG: hypothetical protein JNJ40_00590 [Bacteroidia bacterium]|nr:hypothetical protein [Bacteroidia bacterium]
MKFGKVNKATLTFIFITLYLLTSFTVFSQKDSLQKSKTKAELLDIYLSAGQSNFPVFSVSQKDFKKIVPDSKLMAGELMEVDNNNYHNFPYNDSSEGGHYSSVPGTGFSVQGGITLKLTDNEIKNVDGPWLKLGFNYFSYFHLLNSGVYKTRTRHYDTMYYAGTNVVERDSVNSGRIEYKYGCQSANIEATLLYKFNDKGIFSVFGGPGIMIGTNFGASAQINATQFRSATDVIVLSPTNKLFYNGSISEDKQKEEFKFGPNFSFGVFIVCGVDMRLGNTVAIVKRTHLFAEFKPIFRGNGVKGGGFQQSVLYAADLGLRYEIK